MNTKVKYVGGSSIKPVASMVEAWRSRMTGLRDRVVNLEMSAHSLATRLSLRAGVKPGELEKFAGDVGAVSDDLAKLHSEIYRAYPVDEAKAMWKSLGGDASLLAFGWLESRDLAALGRKVRGLLEAKQKRLFDASEPIAMQELNRRLRGG